MTPAQWAWLAQAHAEREVNEREFQVKLVQSMADFFVKYTKTIIGSEQYVPEGSPKGSIISLIGALITPEKLQAIQNTKSGGNLTEDAEAAFRKQLREKMLAQNSIGLPPEVLEHAPTPLVNSKPDSSAGSFDNADFSVFDSYLDPDSETNEQLPTDAVDSGGDTAP